MRKYLFGLIVFFAVVTSASCFDKKGVKMIKVSSGSFRAGTSLASKHADSACGGANISPSLSWRGIPAGTKSLALVCHDPDAPAPGGWYHWISVNIPAATSGLSEGEKTGEYIVNSSGSKGYSGPCPPPGHGAHRYNFTVYALDVEKIETGQDISPAEVGETDNKTQPRIRQYNRII